MANGYSTNKFTLDSDGTGIGGNITLADLIALKGSAPAHTDTIAIWNGKRLHIQDTETLLFLRIWLGDNAGVAVTAGQRYGEYLFDAGSTLSPAGHATLNCINQNPASPDASSKNCKGVMAGTSAKPVTFTNSVGALDTTKRYYITAPYGDTIASYVNINYCFWSNFFNTMACNSVKSNIGTQITNIVQSPAGVVGGGVTIDNANIDLPIKIHFLTVNISALSMGTTPNYAIVGANTLCFLVAGGSISWTGLKWLLGTGYTSGTLINPCGIYPNISDTYYYGRDSVSFSADVLPTQIVPADFALIDMKDGLVKFTISNIASYLNNEDEIVVYDNLNVIRSCVNKARYVANGNYGLIPSLGVGTELAGWYAKTTSDNKIYSEASAVAGTITTLPTPKITSLDKTVLPTSGGALVATGIGLTGANLYPWILGGDAVTVVVDSDTQITITVPAITAGLKSLAGTTDAGAVSITNAITVQAGATAPGVVTVTGYATGKYANLSWTMAATSVTYDIEIDGVVYTGYTSLSAEIAMPRANTEYSFRVRGVNSVGNGAWSTAITVKTEVVADDETIALAGTAVLSSVENLTGTLHIAQGMTGAKIFDPIIIPDAISQETFEYYVKDVLYNQGRNVL